MYGRNPPQPFRFRFYICPSTLHGCTALGIKESGKTNNQKLSVTTQQIADHHASWSSSRDISVHGRGARGPVVPRVGYNGAPILVHMRHRTGRCNRGFSVHAASTSTPRSSAQRVRGATWTRGAVCTRLRQPQHSAVGLRGQARGTCAKWAREYRPLMRRPMMRRRADREVEGPDQAAAARYGRMRSGRPTRSHLTRNKTQSGLVHSRR